MDRSGQLLTAALLRPLNLVAPGAGLLLALSPWGPWWTFPISLLPYLLMVMLSVRDPKFIERALQTEESAGEPIKWDEALKDSTIGLPPWSSAQKTELGQPLVRIANSEKKLAAELATSSVSARGVVAGTLTQVRAAGRLAIELAGKAKRIDDMFANDFSMDPLRAREQADERRRRAALATDAEAKRALLDAAKSMEESALSAEAMINLRARTVAQLESLAASLESVAVRTIRLRVSSDDGTSAGAIGETLRVDVEAVKETLSVFEEQVALEESVLSSRAKGP